MRQRGAIGWFKHDITHRGTTAWALFFLLLGFYFFLYFPDKIGEGAQIFGASKASAAKAYALGKDLNIFEDFMRYVGGALGFELKRGWDPIWNKWTLYGTLYTLAITIGGLFVIRKYKHNRYQIVRTCCVIGVQSVLAFALPMALSARGDYGYYFSYFWPLKIDYFYPSTLSSMPIYLILYSVIGGLLIAPILGVFLGKRWYCSWVCGCGGLANTFGDPWRRLSDKGSSAWAFERVSIHSMLVIAILTTIVVGIGSFVGSKYPGFEETATIVKFLYGLIAVALLSGAVGVAFYPIGGTRVWCRYFCPMAAMLGLVQKFGRYRITVKPNMCISCGLCSTYCEMGIDVRAYAQKNESFVRASCVGCGLCAEVCPRGVLRLENKRDLGPQQLTMSDLLSEEYKREDNNKAL